MTLITKDDTDSIGISSQGKILVVDDEEKNRSLLRECLALRGYEVEEAVDGQDALNRVSGRQPDVILLDLMMPKINGFEVCARLKKDPRTAMVPILIITALSDRKERLMGIEAGANDYLVKPLDLPDVLLRVANAVREKHLHDRLEASFQKLRTLEGLRDNLIHMVVHDMRNPLMVIRGYLEILARNKQGHLSAQESDFIDAAMQSTLQLNTMVNNLLVSCAKSSLNYIDTHKLRLIVQQ